MAGMDRKGNHSLTRWLAGVACLAMLVGLGRLALFAAIEREAFEPKPAGAFTPESFGIPSRQIVFASSQRKLRASYVQAADPAAPALMICHGDEENLSDWAIVQALLYHEGISSFVFDYSGYGASSGRPNVNNLHQDGLEAYRRFVADTPLAARRYVLGYSLGSGVLLDIVNSLSPAPSGVVIAAGFATAHAAAVATGIVPSWLAPLLPEPWDNEAQVRKLTLPLLLTHSRSDKLIPFANSERLAGAAAGPHRLVAYSGLVHNAAIEGDQAARFWAPITAYLRSGQLDPAEAGPTGMTDVDGEKRSERR
ncbi:alpha/beta hydrolase [Cupriavidus sp. IDO]|uniref:alpha/beta hydrolase n=1 Tax=Cupriavidus sp. IDO TaxID=1539142 RepID=UPI0007C6F007|nr:alpha/beta hydrolase [Cupriavidus sp. IDO]